MFLINFLDFSQIRYFPKRNLIVIKLIAKINYIVSYVLFRTRTTMKFVNSKICVAIYSSFKLTSLLNLQTNMATLIVKFGIFAFFGVCVSNFCPYQMALKSMNFTPTNNGRLIPRNNFMLLAQRQKYLRFI